MKSHYCNDSQNCFIYFTPWSQVHTFYIISAERNLLLEVFLFISQSFFYFGFIQLPLPCVCATICRKLTAFLLSTVYTLFLGNMKQESHFIHKRLPLHLSINYLSPRQKLSTLKLFCFLKGDRLKAETDFSSQLYELINGNPSV